MSFDRFIDWCEVEPINAGALYGRKRAVCQARMPNAILHSAFFLLHSPRGGFVGALWEPCGRIRVALGWL